MKDLILTLIAGIAPIPVVYYFYRRYFSFNNDFTRHVEYFLFGVLLAGIIYLIKPFTLIAIPGNDPFTTSFIRAALLEKSGAFLVILLLMRRDKQNFTVIDTAASAILIGLGFAAFENILFAAAIHSSVILVRFMSSVPLHILSCGIMGYFLASMRLSRTLTGRLFYFSAAVIIPVIFHGTFDYLLILGNISTYVIPVLLVCLIIITEYLLAKSQIIPSIKYFSEMNIGLEDWKTIKMEPQFDRWILRSMGTPNVNAVPFFSLHLSTVKIILIVTALILSIFSFLLPQTVSKIAVTLSRHEFMMLFVFLPALYGFNIFIVGIINPKYFENSIIRIPIIIDTVFSFDADVQKEDDVVDTVTYHITPSNSYFKTPRSFQPGTSVKCILFCARFSSPVIKGVVSYDTHNDAAKFNGTLLRFTSRPAGFWLFFLRYNIYRLLRGITFNLHLPGSKIIRELFVRPVSVMQDKECCNAGHVVFKQGEPGRKFYYVHSGKVDIVKTFKSGKQTRLTTLTRGDIFGEMSLVGNQPRLATAVCRTDCVLAVADSDNLDALIRSNPEFARKLIENFAGHCYQTDVLSGQNITDITRSKNKDIKFLLSLIRVILKVEKDHSTIENLTNGLCDKLKCDHDKIIKMITRIEEVNASTDILAGIDKDTYSAVIKRRD